MSNRPRSLLSIVLALIVTFGLCGAAEARTKVSLDVSYTVFWPSSSHARDVFGSPWSGIGVGVFEVPQPDIWGFTWDVSFFTHDALGKARLLPVTVGYQRGFSGTRSVQPYVALRAGPYWGKVSIPSAGIRDTTVGLNGNVAMGVFFSRRFFVEARYDAFTHLAGTDFNGFSIAGGVRVLDVTL